MKRFEPETLKNAAATLFSHAVDVRFQDVDAAGIVYFARVFDYVHAAYEELLKSAGVPLSEVLKENVWAAPLRHAELTYRSPLRFGDRVCVELVACEEEETEISLGFRLKNQEQRLVATGLTVHTFIDPKTFQRSVVPTELKLKLAALRT